MKIRKRQPEPVLLQIVNLIKEEKRTQAVTLVRLRGNCPLAAAERIVSNIQWAMETPGG